MFFSFLYQIVIMPFTFLSRQLRPNWIGAWTENTHTEKEKRKVKLDAGRRVPAAVHEISIKQSGRVALHGRLSTFSVLFIFCCVLSEPFLTFCSPPQLKGLERLRGLFWVWLENLSTLRASPPRVVSRDSLLFWCLLDFILLSVKNTIWSR